MNIHRTDMYIFTAKMNNSFKRVTELSTICYCYSFCYCYWNRGAYLQKHIRMGALIRKGALIGRRALNRIITVHTKDNLATLTSYLTHKLVNNLCEKVSQWPT